MISAASAMKLGGPPSLDARQRMSGVQDETSSSAVRLERRSGPWARDRERSNLRLMVIDPRALTRDCLVAALRSATGIGTVMSAATVEDAKDQLSNGTLVDTVLINLASDPFGNAELASFATILRLLVESGGILLLTNLIDEDHAKAAIEHGIQGYLSSDTPFDLTIEAIRFVSRGWLLYPAFGPATFLSPRVPQTESVAVRSSAALTRRQQQVLEALERGMTNRDIAARLAVSERTVKAHVQELMRRLGVSNRTQVVAMMLARTRAHSFN